MSDVCKTCGKKVKNLKLHMRYAHGEAKAKKPNPAQLEVSEESPLSKEDLLRDQDQPDNETEYVCGDCQTKVKFNQPTCPKCGQRLVWEALGEGNAATDNINP